ncbi:integumentary mucin C.1-like isoform X2 [Haliotis rubra]|uniref:integumentary mucin C.1-like isoform X2 n=1 Tax=Haliotis rubra TaxID=36100 RepID=UPI001EE5CE2E|nr:integumentary mucin C.1-like isoform X2 [Haliotis rubra]
MSVLRGVMKTALVLLALGLSTGTSQAAVACQDHDVICSTTADVCSDPLGPKLCPETCHACPTETVTMPTKGAGACEDHHIACSTVVDICSHSFGPALCAKTCDACPSAPSTVTTTTPTAPSTVTTTTPTAPSTVTTTTPTAPSTVTTTTPTAPSTVNSTTPTVSPTTTTTTSTAPSTATTHGSSPSAKSTATTTTPDTPTSAPAATTNTSPTTDNGPTTTGAQTSPWSSSAVYSSASVPSEIPTSKPTAGKVLKRSCLQCGDETRGIFCTIMETIIPKSYPCPEGMGFCMSDVQQHMDATTKYRRRCVDEATCNMQWYKQTSGNSECVGVDPTTLSSNVTCMYCCTTDNCNTGIIPNSKTLYKPHP